MSKVHSINLDSARINQVCSLLLIKLTYESQLFVNQNQCYILMYQLIDMCIAILNTLPHSAHLFTHDQ